MNIPPAQHLTIGAAAHRAGVGIDTIRYYEREGLLPPASRRASGYRDYDPGVVERLRFIRRAKDLGFTLQEIRELLALSTDRERGVKSVKQRAEARASSRPIPIGISVRRLPRTPGMPMLMARHGQHWPAPFIPARCIQIGPGTCPKCGMALEPLIPEAGGEEDASCAHCTAMGIAHYHCQLGTQARELYQKVIESDFANQDLSGIINYLANADIT